TTNVTPFDNTFLPDANEPHVQLTEDNVAFALLEILTPPLSFTDNNSNIFKLEQNPVQNEIVLLSSITTEEASISLVDITGKLVFTQVQNLNERNVLTVNIKPGIYALNVVTASNKVFRTKVIIAN
ncbi:T9SS type A sorting domain-containing protein, partial [Winogradskyella sp.]|nr:T9SS type A sorting domain-containing protein [Winogradskyella sp.]